MDKQKDMVLDALRKGVTNRDLVIQFGINSPTARISELVRSGYNITKEKTTYTNRDGKKKHYITYRLEEST